MRHGSQRETLTRELAQPRCVHGAKLCFIALRAGAMGPSRGGDIIFDQAGNLYGAT